MIMRKLNGLIFLLFLSIVTCNDESAPRVVEATAVRLNVSEQTVAVGTTCTLTASVFPQNAVDKQLMWHSDEERIARVAEDGTVTARRVGETRITAQTANLRSDTCRIYVVSEYIPAEKITLTEHETCLVAGDSAILSYDVVPEDANDRVLWNSSDERVATVDRNGKIRPVSVGETWLTVRAGIRTDSCKVLVIANGTLSVQKIDPLVKAIPGVELPADTVTERVARGETATLQFAVTATGKAVASLTPRLVSFAKEDGTGIDLTPTLGWLRNVKSHSSWHDWAGGRPADELLSAGDIYPDPILPVSEWSVSLERGERAALWCEFAIPRDFPAGRYKGVISFSGEAQTGTVTGRDTFYVQVYPVTLPREQSLCVINWEHGSYDAMNAGQPVETNSARFFELQAKVIELVSAYGQNAFRINGLCPQNIPAYSVYNDEKKAYELKFDFSVYDAPIQNYIDYCPNLEQLHGTSFIGVVNGRMKAAIKYLDAAGNVSGKGAFADDPDAAIFYEAYFSQLETYFKSKKLPDGRTWFDIYVQALYDEPTDGYAAGWNAFARLIKNGSPTINLTEATSTNRLDPALCDYLCPLLDKLGNTVATGNQTQWFYTAMAPQGSYANRLIRMPLIKTRILHWVNFKYNASGYLHWGLKYWQEVDNPYGDVAGYFPGGDMFIIYPGFEKVYPSIRFAAMRDGIRDYELLKMVEARSSAQARSFADELVFDYSSYNTDIAHFRDLRRRMLEFLSN